MNKILITGGAGYIGRSIVNALYKKNEITVIDNLSTGNYNFIKNKCIFFKEDLNDYKFLKNFFYKKDFDIIIHLAASINVEDGEKNKKFFYKNNVINTINLLDCIKEKKIKTFIFSSTAGVYGLAKPPTKENHKLKPINFYSHTKKICENNIIRNSKKYNFNYIILRFFNVCGADVKNNIGQINTKNDSLINNLTSQIDKKNPTIKVYGNNYNTKDGTCVRDYIHVSDLAEVHKKLISNKKTLLNSNIFNCGYGKGYSVNEIIKKFKKKIKKRVKILIINKRTGDIPASYADVSFLKKKITWKPKYNNLDVIINSSILWQKKLKKIKKYI